MTSSRRSFLPVTLLFLAAAPACILGPDIVGETLTEAQLSAGAGSTTDAQDTNVSATTQIELTDGAALGYGQPCELGPPEAMIETGDPPDPDDPNLVQASVLSAINDCASDMCLFVYDNNLPPTCEVDADCGTPDAACWEGQCHLHAPYVFEHSRCTQACETAADCPDVEGCATGMSCVVVRMLGTYCCQPVCACNDQLDLAAAEMKATQCEAGFPGCT